jgi:hypothetical protein
VISVSPILYASALLQGEQPGYPILSAYVGPMHVPERIIHSEETWVLKKKNLPLAPTNQS